MFKKIAFPIFIKFYNSKANIFIKDDISLLLSNSCWKGSQESFAMLYKFQNGSRASLCRTSLESTVLTHPIFPSISDKRECKSRHPDDDFLHVTGKKRSSSAWRRVRRGRFYSIAFTQRDS